MKKIYIPQGGGRDFWLRIPMNNESAGRHLCMDDVDENEMHVWLESGYGGCWTLVWEKDGAQRDGIAAKFPASQLGYGTYSVVMAGKFVNGDYFRTKRQLFIRLVDREDQADAEPTMYNEEQAYWAGPAVLSEMLSRDGLNTYELWILQGNEGTLEDYLSVSGLTLNDFMVRWNHLSVEVQSKIDRAEQTAINPKGDYDEEVEYHANDLVYDSETLSSYVSLLSHNTGNPVTDTTYWMKVLDGDDINQIKQDAEDEIDDALQDARTATSEAIAAKNAANAVAAQKVAQAQIGYYECNSLATDATKVTTSGTIGTDTYVITENGGQMKIRMDKANSVNSNVKLQIGNTTALPLYYNGLPASTGNSWEEGEVISVYYYDNKYWASNVQGGGGSGDGAFDISKYKTVGGVIPTYKTLAEALGTNGANVPDNKRKGGMSVKYIQLTEATYKLTKTEGIETQPTGTEIQEAITIPDGTYTAAQLEGIETLPANIGSSVTYYLTVTEEVEVEPETEGDEPTTETVTTYTTWVITKLTDDMTEYVQWMLKNTQWSIDEKDWAGIDVELGEDKTGTPTTKAVSEYVQLREDVVAAALCDLHKNLTVLPDDIMRYNSRKKKILAFGASIEANARSGSGWDVNDPRGWLYWLNKAPYVDTIYNFANGSSCLTSRTTSTYSPNYRTSANNTINIYWNQIIHSLQRYLAGDIETPDVVLICSGANDIQWTANNRSGIFDDTADEIFSANMNDFNFTGYTNEQVINGDFPDDGEDIAEMRRNMLTIAKAVRYISEIIYTYWPETQIIWMGNMYTRGGDIPRANVENRFNEFVDKIESCCVKMGIPCIRSDKECGRWMIYEMKKHIEAGGSASDDYNQGKAHAWGFTQDGYHPTVKGAEMFGRYMINKLASVLRY